MYRYLLFTVSNFISLDKPPVGKMTLPNIFDFLLLKPNRQELKQKIEEIKSKIAGE